MDFETLVVIELGLILISVLALALAMYFEIKTPSGWRNR